MSFWDHLVDQLGTSRIQYYSDPPISVICGALIKRCHYFLVEGTGVIIGPHDGNKEFELKIAPTESAFSVKFSDGMVDNEVGRCGLTDRDANGRRYDFDTSPFIPRSPVFSPSNLIHYEELPLWCTGNYLSLSG